MPGRSQLVRAGVAPPPPVPPQNPLAASPFLKAQERRAKIGESRRALGRRYLAGLR